MPKIVNREDMQNAILDAAVQVFAERGYHSATIAEVASAAELGKGTLYLYFKNKEAMAQAMVARHFERLRRQISEVQEPDDLNGLLRSLDQLLDVAPGDARFMRVFFEVFGPSFASENFTDTIAAAFDEFAQVYARQLERLQGLGEIRADIDPAIAGRALASAIDGMVLHRSLFGLSPERYRDMRRMFLDCFGAGLIA